ncbi:hypothetical protein MNB_SV-14-1531 [hydrothermal vent metagenome]|uniref:Uncharacterized protein n=1 Tax=hydrothermal vent metagenome TaxID=652676 RepID=A0A1W1CH19_9ZZZZ
MHLQRFIIEGDYRLSSIIEKLKEKKLIELDVSNEEKMPEFTIVAEEFDNAEIEYKLYKKIDEVWEESELDDLDLDRTPLWLILLFGMVFISYFVVGLIQSSAIYNLYNTKYEIYGLFSAIGAVITAYIPILGSIVAYNSATELWNWSWYNALFIFFFYYLPLFGFIVYILWIILKAYYSDRWYRFWRSEFN